MGNQLSRHVIAYLRIGFSVVRCVRYLDNTAIDSYLMHAHVSPSLVGRLLLYPGLSNPVLTQVGLI
jgi:hypothetical protein